MSPRAGIIAGKSVIVVQVQDSVDAALKRIGSNLNKFSAKVNRLGFEMFSGGFLGSLGLTALAKQFEDFEDKLLFLSTKLVATEAELAGVEKTIRQLGRTTSFTASQVADAATVLAQAGFNAAQVTKLLQPTLDLARGAQIDLASSGAILANTLRSFSLETEKATEVASQFIAAARLGTLDVLDLKESIKEVLGTVRNLNIDLPTTLALITQLAERSLKGTKAGTSLNTALLQLASKGKQLAKLGLVLPENIDGPGFIKFLEQLYDKISKLGNLKRTAVLQSIFNIRGGRAITALDDIKKIIDLQKQIAAAGDEARKAAVKMDSGFGGAIRRASSAIEGLTLRWGKLLADAIIPTLDLVPALSLALEQLTKANQTLVTGLILSPVAILGLGAGLLVASFAAAKLAGMIGLLASGIRGTGRLIGGLLTQQLTNVAVLMDRIRKSARSFDRGLSAALLTPQLVGGRGRNARKVKPTSFLGRVGNAPTSFAGIAKTLITPVTLLIASLTKLGPIATAAFRAATAGAKSLYGVIAPLGIIIIRVIRQIRLLAAAKWLTSLNFFGTIFQGIKDISSSLSGSFRSGFIGFISGLLRLSKSGIVVIGLGLRKIWNVDFVRILFNISKSVWSITKAFGALAAIGFKTLTTLSGWGNILTFLIIFGPKIKFIREAFTRLGSGIAAAFQAIGMIGTAVGPAFTLIARSMKTLLAGQGDLGFDQLTTGLRAIVSIVGNQLSQAWDHVALAIAPAYDFMSKMISATFELGGLLGSVFGSTFGTTVMNLGDLFSKGFSGQSMGSMLKELFDAIDLKTIFIGISLLIKSIGDQLLMVFKGLYDVVANTMQELTYALASFLQLLPTTFFGQGGKVAGAQLQASVSGMDLAQLKAGKLFEQASLSLTKSLDGVIGRLENIFNAPALTPAKIKALNLSYTESQVQQMLLDFANEGARKAEMQRVNKLTSPNPTILGSLAVQDRRSPIQKLQEEMTKVRRNLVHENSLTDLIGMNRTRDKRMSGMREKLADIRARIKEELKAQRQMPISAPQRAVLSDIVSSTTGSFQQTRRNLVKLASGQSVEQKSLTALEQIQDNTSNTTGNLDQILQNGLPVTMGLK